MTGLEPAGPARKAGIEVGDVIVEANGAPFISLDQLAENLRQGGLAANLGVRDVNSGRDAKVPVTMETLPDRTVPPPVAANHPAPSRPTNPRGGRSGRSASRVRWCPSAAGGLCLGHQCLPRRPRPARPGSRSAT